jgi:hypothetical protein
MSVQNSEEENHWPGYVDALTTMTMMLIFVMTILAVAIFGLSQNVSRNMVEKIAKAVNIDDVTSSENTDSLASRVVAKLELQQQATMLAKAGTGPDGAGGKSLDSSSSEGTGTDAEHRLASGETAARQKPVTAQVDQSPAFITISFQKRATGLDSETSDKIKAAMADGRRLHENIELKAFAETSGAVSDSRRIAFYRLLNLRSQLIAMGVPPDRIKATIENSAAQDSGDKVRIDLAKSG